MPKKTSPKQNKVDDTQVESSSGQKDCVNSAQLEDALKWLQVVYTQNKQIKRRLTFIAIGSYVRLFLFLIPLLFAIMYLPPLIEQYSEVFGQFSQGGTGMSEGQIKQLIEAYGL